MQQERVTRVQSGGQVPSRNIRIQEYGVRVYSGVSLGSTPLCSIPKQGAEVTLFLNTFVF